jgi:hypothetical protein
MHVKSTFVGTQPTTVQWRNVANAFVPKRFLNAAQTATSRALCHSELCYKALDEAAKAAMRQGHESTSTRGVTVRACEWYSSHDEELRDDTENGGARIP